MRQLRRRSRLAAFLGRFPLRALLGDLHSVCEVLARAGALVRLVKLLLSLETRLEAIALSLLLLMCTLVVSAGV